MLNTIRCGLGWILGNKKRRLITSGFARDASEVANGKQKKARTAGRGSHDYCGIFDYGATEAKQIGRQKTKGHEFLFSASNGSP